MMPKVRDILKDTEWSDPIRLELKVAKIQREQEENGWLLDVPLCLKHIAHLEEKINELDTRILSGLKPRVVKVKTTVREGEGKLWNKDGSEYNAARSYWGDKYPEELKGAYSRISFVPFDLNSTTQVKEFLLDLGWKPLEWNYNDAGEKTSPKLTEESLEALTGGLGGLIAERFVVIHRLRQLRGFVTNVRDDGRIEAQANSVGTNTSRFKHRVVVNVPKAGYKKDGSPKAFFGTEMRSVFTVGEGRILVGCDAKSLEGRVMAHYANDPSLTEILLSGDSHTMVWEAIIDYCSTRDMAKNIFYAWLYGATDPKLGYMADKHPKGMTDAQIGAEIRASILKIFPALDKLVEGVQRAAKRGYLYGLDGRHIPIRSKHSALNALFQSAGAIIMKVALCFAYDWIKKENLDAKIVGNFHDEWQWDVLLEHSKRVAELLEKSIVQTGHFFRLNCGMEGESKCGKNWAETH